MIVFETHVSQNFFIRIFFDSLYLLLTLLNITVEHQISIIFNETTFTYHKKLIAYQ